MSPNGLVEFKQTLAKPCPECGGEATTLTQSHKMSCGAHWKLCYKCLEWVGRYSEHDCQSKERAPRVRPAFGIPPRQRPNRWFVEWRWKPRVFKKLTHPEMEMSEKSNSWQAHTTESPKGCATECMARNLVARLRKRFPGKSFRYRGRHVPLPVR